jgi:hypothetical protein
MYQGALLIRRRCRPLLRAACHVQARRFGSWLEPGKAGPEPRSSRHRKTSGVLPVRSTSHNLPKGVLCLTEASSSAPAVVGRHSLALLHPLHPTQQQRVDHPCPPCRISTCHCDQAAARVAYKNGVVVNSSSLMIRHEETRILATTATAEREKRLGLVVAEPLVISMWRRPRAQASAGVGRW